MDGPRLRAALIIHLFSSLNWDWRRDLAFCIHYNNVRHTLANANATREPYARII